jgi:hypothetical protein
MKHFKKYSIFLLLILIIIANLFFVNREGLNNSDVSNNYIIPTYSPNINPPVLPSLPNQTAQPPMLQSMPQPSSSSVGSYAMVCSNDTDCDKYPSNQYNFKGSIDQNGITINKEKTYSCQNGVCIK